MAVRQEFEPAEGESLYGLGQHQDRLLDIAGRDLDLWQHNREVVIPFLVSTRGWGLLWDNPAQTRFGHPEAIVPVPALGRRRTRPGAPGALTAAFFADGAFSQPMAVVPAAPPGSSADAGARRRAERRRAVGDSPPGSPRSACRRGGRARSSCRATASTGSTPRTRSAG